MNFLKTRRMKASMLCGAVLGVVCILGAMVVNGDQKM